MGAWSKDLLMARHTQSVLLTNITKTQTPNHSGHEREASSLSSRNRQHVKSKHNCYQETFPRSVLLEPLLSHPTASYVGIHSASAQQHLHPAYGVIPCQFCHVHLLPYKMALQSALHFSPHITHESCTLCCAPGHTQNGVTWLEQSCAQGPPNHQPHIAEHRLTAALLWTEGLGWSQKQP